MNSDTATGGRIEPRRLSRAVWLDAVRLGPGHDRVTGGSQPHEVQLDAIEGRQCDCADYHLRRCVCKHLLAARLHEGDVEVLEALRSIVRMPA